MNFEMVKSEIVKDGDGSGRAITRAASKGVTGRNSYPYSYLRVEICTRTHTHWVSGGYRVSIGFVIPHVKTILK
jgi:hypothetical protein